jgi:hypothetical protein
MYSERLEANAGPVPVEYARAIGFAVFVAYGVSEVKMDAGRRGHPSSSPRHGIPRHVTCCGGSAGTHLARRG